MHMHLLHFLPHLWHPFCLQLQGHSQAKHILQIPHCLHLLFNVEEWPSSSLQLIMLMLLLIAGVAAPCGVGVIIVDIITSNNIIAMFTQRRR
jgi:hypothetical protein